MGSKSVILVTAATWYIGGQTIAAIKDEGLNAKVVAGVYKKSKKIGERELWKDADETYEFDADFPESVDFKRFDAVCIIPSTDSSRLIQVNNMIDECKNNKSNPFVVLCTVADTGGHDGKYTKSMRIAEGMLRCSGVNHVIINSGFFHENFEWNAMEMMSDNKIQLPIGTGKFAPVCARDVARFIAKILKNPYQYEGRRFSMVGKQLLDGYDVALIASKALGDRIVFEDISESDYAENLRQQGCLSGMTKAFCELCASIKNHRFEKTMDNSIDEILGHRTVSLEHFGLFSRIYGVTRTTTEADGTKRGLVSGLGETEKADEGYAERKGETTVGVVGEGWEPVQYRRKEGLATWESDRDQSPTREESEELKEIRAYRPGLMGGWNLEEEDEDEEGANRDQSDVQYGGEEWVLKEGTDREPKPVQYDSEVTGESQAQSPVQHERESGEVTDHGQGLGREKKEDPTATGTYRPVQYGLEKGWTVSETDRDQRHVQYGREEKKPEAKDTVQYDREDGEEWNLHGHDRKPSREEREKWMEQYKKWKRSRKYDRDKLEDWEANEGWRRRTLYGRKQRDEWKTSEADLGRRPTVYGRKERGLWKAKETDRYRGRESKFKTLGRENEEDKPSAFKNRRYIPLERDIYYMKPEKGVDVLQRVQQDYEALSRFLTDTIGDLKSNFLNRNSLMGLDERLIRMLKCRKDEIDWILDSLDRDVREQERGRTKVRPFGVHFEPPPPNIGFFPQKDEDLREGARRIERYGNSRRERYESLGRETDYAGYNQQRESARFPEGTYREKRRRRSASATHIGRELSRGRSSTMLGRELDNYKGGNIISRISQFLYGWKDTGERTHRLHGGRGFEGGDRYRRGTDTYDYEPTVEFFRRDQDREREERRLRDLKRRDRESKEQRQRDFEYQDRENNENPRWDYRRKYEQENSLETSDEYDDSHSGWQGEIAKNKLEDDHADERRFKIVTRPRGRESGYGSGYFLVPKYVLQEAAHLRAPAPTLTCEHLNMCEHVNM